MIDLSTNYMGLTLKNPVIVGSSGLTRTLDNLIKVEDKGAGAVVLKSLFEEQIKFEIRKVFSYDDVQSAYTEADDYIRNYSRAQTIDEYLRLIQDAKSKISIPVIPSINCVTSDEWPAFAKEIEKAGADALELNVFVLPADIDTPGQEYEKLYFEIIETVKKQVKIPIALKISYHFSGLAELVKKLSWSGIQGMVLFNRFYNPDVDIDKFTIKPGNLYSTPEEISTSLRWIAILADRVQTDLCASTGVHDGYGVVKQLLAGAKAVQVCSALYKHGFDHISFIVKQLSLWMEKNNFEKIEDFRGRLSYKKSDNPVVFHRVQFMKHFAGIE
ncbi:MAG: dihydroorotate dehydrogenase-like protein [Bacteroidetes bacterium]|nr:MAG: dihydroorotate dehydrogenase-like protein [Bacteroidota bacterium]